MKTDFSPKLYRDGGFSPIGGILQGIGGIAQSIIGASQAGRAQRGLNKLIDSYHPNQSIMDYYNKALQKYNVNPYQTALYKNATESAGRGLTNGINALQDRRSALAGVGSLVQQYNDSALKAAGAAENQQAQALNQLGGAAAMKAQEEKYPFELKYNQLASRASGGNSILNSGLSNIFGAGTTLSQQSMLKNMYNNTNG